MSALIGALVAGRYLIEAELGRGGMGVVYRAVQLPMERAVALKVLKKELTGDARARVRFEREARAASALTHPSAVAIHDFGDHEGTAYLAMELVEGRGLRALIEEGVGVARAIDLAAQLADVLASAHDAGLVHRDLKPENVIVESNEERTEGTVGRHLPSSAGVGMPSRSGATHVIDGDRVRVLDFGLAFLERGPGGRMTREGIVVGTPEYLSPEQARGEDVGPATDVYALACVLHELLTGRPPFAGSELDVLTKQMFAPPPPLASETALDVPAALDELRRAMLEKQPARRPSAAEARDRLRALDPDPDRARARARQDGYLGPRAARMVGAGKPSPSEGALEVAIAGTLNAELVLGLMANGITAFTLSRDEALGPETAVIVAPGATEAEVGSLVRSGLPVIATVDRADVARLSTLLRAGAADVATRPLVAADLAKKIRRLARDRARRQRG